MHKQDRLRSIFDYQNGALVWKETRCGRAMAGRVAGSIKLGEKQPRVRVYFDGRLQEVSRLIWEWHHGDVPAGMFIDHIDGDRLNNRVENLRPLTPEENSRNNKRHRAGLPVGVGFHRATKKWRAHIKQNGRQKSLGYFHSMEAAMAARQAAI